ncbi:hypothetical protein MTBUT4_220005 [Magnetospirillum sp. UT-4]|nr:hypothetical protein MTBUT4_220005 [Magnetospirillum sp. UT-4]
MNKERPYTVADGPRGGGHVRMELHADHRDRMADRFTEVKPEDRRYAGVHVAGDYFDRPDRIGFHRKRLWLISHPPECASDMVEPKTIGTGRQARTQRGIDGVGCEAGDVGDRMPAFAPETVVVAAGHPHRCLRAGADLGILLDEWHAFNFHALAKQVRLVRGHQDCSRNPRLLGRRPEVGAPERGVL